MTLKALEMQGFKSFPEKTTLQFGKGITAVVGPNGSGKSNISDAVRWVLGEQSSKSLRGSKMEDVIFDGTKIRKAHGFAQVTLRLDNSDRNLKGYDSEEVSVTRRYYRSGESEYKINGVNVRLKDVHELFMDTGLGRDGYSMVSQGKIADMVSGKGRECREMLEEAAGISSYRYRRNDSLKKLSQAEENLVRLRDILTELESRIGPLKTQSEKAQKFIVLAEEKKEIEIGLWLYNIDKLRENLRKQQDNIAIASGHYEQTEKELAEIEAEIERCISDTQNINIEIDEIRNTISLIEEKSASAAGEQAVLRNSIEHNNETIERIGKDRDDSENSQQQLLKEIATEEKLINQIKLIRDEKRSLLSETEAELIQMQNAGGSLDSESYELSAMVTELTKELSDCRVAYSTAMSSVSEIKSRVEIIDQLIFGKKDNVSKLSNDVSLKEKSIASADAEIISLNNSVNGYSMRLSSKNEKADNCKKELDNLVFESQRASSKIKMLEELEKNMEGYSGAVKRIIKESQKGALGGIHGTISQLISVAPEYAVAIETALGNSIQNIITDTENDAKNAINLLKATNSGRATFQPISAVRGKHLDEKELDDCYGYIDVACNLLRCDDKYAEIISSLLGKVVVAEDLTSAIAIAKKYSYRFKIVTLDGQIINTGGSMTGGSQSQNTGILSRGTEIEKLKLKEKELNDKLTSLQNQYDELVREIEALESVLSSEKEKVVSAQEEKIRLQGEYNLTLQQFNDAKDALDNLISEKSSADERIYSIEGECELHKEKMDELSKQISDNEQKLVQLDSKKSELAEKRGVISDKISSLNIDIHGADRDLSARNQALGLLKARLVSQEDKDKELDKEIELIKQRNAQIERDIIEIANLIDSFASQITKAKQDIVTLQKNRTSAEEKSQNLRTSERSKTAEREKISGELARLEERRDTMTKEYDEIVTKLYDEYQLTKREAEAFCEKPEDPKNAQRRLHEIKNSIRALGSVNVGAIEEYKEVSERYEFMFAQVNDVEKSKKELIRLIEELTFKMSSQFREQFVKINDNFNGTFRELFGGGSAELILENPADVLESNIDIKLQPPGKNVKRLDSLSGGEKGLSAIALLFAIMKVNPAPFCIFDEVEAALDDVNVQRYAQYVRRMTDNTQFILITHRRGTMEEADMLYGITMQEQGVSKLLELKTAELAKKLGITQ